MCEQKMDMDFGSEDPIMEMWTAEVTGYGY